MSRAGLWTHAPPALTATFRRLRKPEGTLFWHAAPLAVAGVHEDHPIDDRRAGDVERSAVRGFAVYCLEFVLGIGVPQNFAGG